MNSASGMMGSLTFLFFSPIMLSCQDSTILVNFGDDDDDDEEEEKNKKKKEGEGE